jgi:hypothetical protein
MTPGRAHDRRKHDAPFQAARRSLRTTSVTAAALASMALTSSAFADDNQSNGITIRPTLSLEVDASDNIRRTATDEQSDVVFVPTGSLLVEGETRDLRLFFSGNLQYDAFLDNTSLDRLTGDLLSHGTWTIVPGFFFLDGNAQISDEFLKATDRSPTGLPNGNPQARIFNSQLSPYITTHPFDESDLTVRGGIADVQFSELDGPSSLAPSDAVIYQASALLTNGDRSRRVEWRLTGDYSLEHRDAGGETTSASGVFGLSVRVLPKLQAIGRVGYELIEDPSISDIRDVVWSGGLMYHLGEISTITAERRHQFGRDAWHGDANIALSSQFAVTGGYEERFETEQQRLSRSLDDIFAQTGNLPGLPSPVSLSEDLVDESFFVKDARAGASYRTTSQNFDLSAIFSQREFTTLSDHDESAGVSARFTQIFPANFRMELEGNYNATLEPRIGQAKTQSYVATGGLTYILSDEANARVAYTWSQTDGIATISEDLVSASVSKSF